MTTDDFPFAVRITNTMKWNMAEEDFEFMTSLEPKGCFVVLADSERVGIVTTISFDKIGWLGNLIVAPSHRNKGAGSLLAKKAIDYLISRNVQTVGLYAYPEKIPFYKRLGFRENSEFTVLKGKGFSSTTVTNLRRAMKEDTQAIFDLDRTCFGASRKKLLDPILHNPDNLCYVSFEDKQMIGYALAKVYEDMAELGPLVCQRGRNDVAADLLKATMTRLRRRDVSVCVPKKEIKLIDVLMSAGFIENFSVAQMFFNPWSAKGCVYIPESLERG